MKTENVNTLIQNKLGSQRAKMYNDSAPMFNAKLLTGAKGCYFIESSVFTGSDMVTQPAVYKLKFVGTNVLPVKEFTSKHDALSFWENMEFTTNGALILERSHVPSISVFYAICAAKFYNKRKYDNYYTALSVCGNCRELLSYCEGDLCNIHCVSDDLFDAEVKSHVDFYNENEG